MDKLPVYRILVLGSIGSGKASLCQRLRIKQFIPRDEEAGYDPAEDLPETEWKSVVDGHECIIEAMIHIAGYLSEYSTRSTLLVISIHGAVVTYDATSPESFALVESHVLEIRKLDAERKVQSLVEVPDYPIVVVGTKVDMVDGKERRRKDGKRLVKRLGLLGLFETSAKSGEGIEEPFSCIVREVRKRQAHESVGIFSVVGTETGDSRSQDKAGWSDLKAKLRVFLS